MDLTATDVMPTRPHLADEPRVFKPRRFSDPVSDLNCDVHDKARLLASAIEMVDRMEIEIIAVEADRSRNSVIQVAYSRACDQLNGVEVTRSGNGFSHWCANRNGVEIRWCIPVEAA